MIHRTASTFLVLWLLVFGFLPSAAADDASATHSLTYPQTRRVNHVDDYHGTKVADPYRWLEEDVRQSAETAAWVEQQNELTSGYLESLPSRDAIARRLEELWDYERYSAPFKAGGRYYYSKNDGLQNQSVLYTLDSLDGEARVVLDPNTWSEDGTVTLGGMNASDDGRYLAYAVQEAGSDWRTWYVMEVETGKLLPDKLEWMKFGGVEWTPDSQGFIYGSFDPPDSGSEYQGLNLNHKLYYHRLGTDRSRDLLVYATPDHPEWTFFPALTEDGRYLVISISNGTGNKNRVVCRDLSRPLAMERSLVDDFDNAYDFVGNDGSSFYFVVDVDAPKSRLVEIDVDHPGPESWREIIPESEDALTAVGLVGNLFVATYLDDAKTSVRLFRTNGKHLRDVELPSLGSAFGFRGKRTDTETFYQFSSFATPPSIYRYDLITGESTLFRQAKVDFNPGDYQVEQVFYESKDGTRVPMFLVHKKDIELDGKNPTLLYGYGGFNVSLTPGFSITRLAWVDMGGVYAMPNLRGGGEYGEEWHEAGTKLHKQNVFDDFISAAEWLIGKGYTSPEKLAIQGASNGGLLVGACLTQRPDLFGAALPAVGVMDMLRFHKFTAGRFWVGDYGSSDDPDEFKALLAYSPYHNIKKGTDYPATLVMTADHDDRVVPSHSFKFAAKLQEAQAGDEPVLIRIESRAGHGGGTPTAKEIVQAADIYSFVVEALGMELPESFTKAPQVETKERPRG